MLTNVIQLKTRLPSSSCYHAANNGKCEDALEGTRELVGNVLLPKVECLHVPQCQRQFVDINSKARWVWPMSLWRPCLMPMTKGTYEYVRWQGQRCRQI